MRFLLKFMGLIGIIGMLFVTGTVVYHNTENLSYTDSFYFTGITLLTIGYGDIHPTQPFTKIFTVFFGMAGVGMMLLFLTIVSQELYTRQEKFREKAQRRATNIAKRVIKHHTRRFNKLQKGILRGSKLGKK